METKENWGAGSLTVLIASDCLGGQRQRGGRWVVGERAAQPTVEGHG
jgi:hypothetical protein